MKKMMLLILSLLMLFACFSAVAEDETQLVSFYLPEGAEYTTLPNTELTAPSGLESMYELMGDANNLSDTYLFRMKNGRVLVSVASTYIYTTGTAEMLMEGWPLIAESIGRGVQYINADESCVKVENRYGFDTMRIDTDIAVGQEDVTMLTASCNTFFREEELIEVWAVMPSDSTYLYDGDAAAELQSDMKAAEIFLDSLTFSNEVQSGIQTVGVAGGAPVTYLANDGSYQLDVPAGCYLVNADTSNEALQMIRWEFTSAYGATGARLFDRWYSDIAFGASTLFLTPDLSSAIVVSMDEFPGLSAVDFDQWLGSMAADITAQLAVVFSSAEMLDSSQSYQMNETDNFAAQEFIFELDDLDIGSIWLTTVKDTDLLVEVDLYSLTFGAQYLIDDELVDLVVGSFEYLPPSAEPPSL